MQPLFGGRCVLWEVLVSDGCTCEILCLLYAHGLYCSMLLHNLPVCLRQSLLATQIIGYLIVLFTLFLFAFILFIGMHIFSLPFIFVRFLFCKMGTLIHISMHNIVIVIIFRLTWVLISYQVSMQSRLFGLCKDLHTEVVLSAPSMCGNGFTSVNYTSDHNQNINIVRYYCICLLGLLFSTIFTIRSMNSWSGLSAECVYSILWSSLIPTQSDMDFEPKYFHFMMPLFMENG